MPITDDDLWSALTSEQKTAALDALRDTQAQAEPEPTPEPAEPQPVLHLGQYAQLDDFLDDTLLLAYQDSRYSVLAPDMETGLECQKLLGIGVAAGATGELSDEARQVLDDADERALFVRVLGGDTTHPRYDPAHDVWRQITTVEQRSWPFIQHVARTVIYWVGLDDREFALRYWMAGGRPKDPEPAAKAPQDRKPKGGATTTQKRASGSSTRPKPTEARKGTGGRKSGDAGG